MGSTGSPTYLIVGAGVFGASTALYLAETRPDASITLIDRAPAPGPHPTAASSDLNKIVRADYDDIFYMRLALDAVDRWRHDKLYSPYYHECGMLFAEDIQMGPKSYENYKALGVDPGAVFFAPEDAKAKFPMFQKANWTDVDENYWNPRSGWGEGDGAVRAVIQAAIRAGVHYVEATISKLLFDGEGDCLGVSTTDSKDLKADHVILCTGARTALLLADSAPEREDLQVNGRMVAAAATSCIVQCDPKSLYLYQQAPVHFLGMHHTHGESIPPGPDGRLKFNFEVSFTNKEYHEASGQTISVPPARQSQSTWSDDIPNELKKSVLTVVDHVYGKDAPGLQPESFRMCWDAVTPNQDWIISPHPACKNLFIAGGGSFHSWKFLPVLGQYVTQMVYGELSAEHEKRWAWDRENEGAACVMYIPQRDLKDMDGGEFVKRDVTAGA